MTSQLEIFQDGVTADDVARLRTWLATHGWQTRKQLKKGLHWSERKIRDVAEMMGSAIVRSGRSGFKLTDHITRDDLPSALQAAQAAISQGKRMIRYGINLQKQIHRTVG